MAKIAIIGCGYVGSALGRELVRHGHDCVGTTTTPTRFHEIAGLGIRPALLDIADTNRLGGLLSDRDMAYLTIAAGRADRSYRETYVDGAASLMAAAGANGANGANGAAGANCASLRRIVYTSSTGVYAQDDGSWVDETSDTKPDNDDGRALVDAERVILEGAERLGITATVLRLAGIYGPSRDPADRIARMAGSERSNGDTLVNLVHRDDIVAALLRLVDVPYLGILNLAADTPTTRRSFYDRLVAARGLEPIRWAEKPGRNLRGKRVRNSLIKRELGLALAHPRYEMPSPPS